MKKNLILGVVLLPVLAYSQVGINTRTPRKNLHVNGSLQITNELNVGGDARTAGSAGTPGQVLKSNGPGLAPTWQNVAGVPNATGTVIALNGEFIIAQEIVVQLTADYTVPPAGNAGLFIGNLTNEIIDNENRYSGTSIGNSFTIPADGVFQIKMNAQLSTDNGSVPVIGIWDDTANRWVACVNDYFSTPTGGLQTYTLITSIPMTASSTYSFRLANTVSTVVKYVSTGITGAGPITQISLKRLK
ncbi:hypothetical protein [Chryseobacterium shigense]|nr:hypothetical protein [Chryseobacterium shigense]